MSTSIQPARRAEDAPSRVQIPGDTIVDVFRNRVRSGGARSALRWSTADGWQTTTWEAYGQAVAEVALGLRVARSITRANADHAHAEGVRRWASLPGELSLARGELTPTLKVRRSFVVQENQELIDELYATP